MNPIDINAMFKAHVAALLLQEEDLSQARIEQLEDSAAELYLSWILLPQEQLGGASVHAFFAAMSGGQLIQALSDYTASNVPPPDILLDTIVDTRPLEELSSLLLNAPSADLRLCAAELLLEIDANRTRGVFLQALQQEEDPRLAERVIQALGADSAEDLLALLENCSKAVRDCILDVLSESSPDASLFPLVEAEFSRGERLQLYAPMLARFGEQAIAPLTSVLRTELGYLDFLAVRDALEMLGEIVETRNFSGDPDYEAVRQSTGRPSERRKHR